MKFKFNKNKLIFAVYVVIVLCLIFFCGVFYFKYKSLSNDQVSIDQKETKNILNEISKTYLMPTDEEPTIATVVDPALLKDQIFFNDALKDDNVIIFAKSGKVILYRSSTHKIINVSSISPKNTSNMDGSNPLNPESTINALMNNNQ